jgi:hypothetical protein
MDLVLAWLALQVIGLFAVGYGLFVVLVEAVIWLLLRWDS